MKVKVTVNAVLSLKGWRTWAEIFPRQLAARGSLRQTLSLEPRVPNFLPETQSSSTWPGLSFFKLISPGGIYTRCIFRYRYVDPLRSQSYISCPSYWHQPPDVVSATFHTLFPLFKWKSSFSQTCPAIFLPCPSPPHLAWPACMTWCCYLSGPPPLLRCSFFRLLRLEEAHTRQSHRTFNNLEFSLFYLLPTAASSSLSLSVLLPKHCFQQTVDIFDIL